MLGAFTAGVKCLCGLAGKWAMILNVIEHAPVSTQTHTHVPPADEKVQTLDKMTWWSSAKRFSAHESSSVVSKTPARARHAPCLLCDGGANGL